MVSLLYNNLDLIIALVQRIDKILDSIRERIAEFNSLNDFVGSPQGMLVLDAVSMQFINIGETLKSIDKLTNNMLLKKYPEYRGIK